MKIPARHIALIVIAVIVVYAIASGGDVKTAFKFVGIEFLLETKHPTPRITNPADGIQKAPEATPATMK